MIPLVRRFFEITFLPVIRGLYRLRVLHAGRFPREGGVMLLPNHVSYLDSFILYAACPRPVRFVIVSHFMKVKAIGWFLRLFNAIPLNPARAREAIQKTAEALAAGDVVCMFPEGQLTRTGMLGELKKGFELIARRGGDDCVVLPVYMHGLWDSIFSFERGRVFKKWPNRSPLPVTVAFAEARPSGETDHLRAREALLAVSADAVAHPRGPRPPSAAEAAVRGLKRRPGAPCFIEYGKRRRQVNRDQALGIGIGLARRWRETLPADETRFGVLLPAGSAPALVNLGLLLAGRVPVNLPFTGVSFDREALAAALDDLGIRTVFTARAFAGQLQDFPWRESEAGGGRFLDMSAEMQSVPVLSMSLERLFARIEPAWMTIRRLDLRAAPPAPGGEAFGYLTAGYDPVLLTHRQILAQFEQLRSGAWLERGETLLCEDGLASAAGAAFAFWLPVLGRHAVAGRSLARLADGEAIETIVADENVRRIVLNPRLAEQIAAFPEPWHPATRENLRSIFTFAGREADSTGLGPGPDPVRSDTTGSGPGPNPVESVTGTPVCPCWAPDALGIVVSMSLPDPEVIAAGGHLQVQFGRKPGSVGRLLPGTIASRDGEGRLSLRGPSLGDSAWIDTGVAGSFDEAGFLFPESF